MLNDAERFVAQCIIMRLKEREAFDYLKTNGHEISRITYYRIKSRLDALKLKATSQNSKVRIYRPAFTKNRRIRIDRAGDVEDVQSRGTALQKGHNTRKDSKYPTLFISIL